LGRAYSKVATGGTFDKLHAGHRRLLDKSFEVGDQVVIGLTSDEFARREKGKKALVRSYRDRAAALKAYLRRTYPGRRYTVAKLDDYFGPGIARAGVEALVASPETGKRIELANRLRAERGFPPLRLVVIDWVTAEDGQPISSTRIRGGEIDEEGRMLRSVLRPPPLRPPPSPSSHSPALSSGRHAAEKSKRATGDGSKKEEKKKKDREPPAAAVVEPTSAVARATPGKRRRGWRG
jgi:pantetheine-phosphate adenylyltransferase